MHVGVFDAGVGGLTVLRELLTAFPGFDYSYLADRENFPYYRLTEPQLAEVAARNTAFLLEKGCDVVVVACNTAAVAALPVLKAQFAGKTLLATVPPIRKASEMTQRGAIGVFSTPRTKKSEYLARLIEREARGLVVYKVSSSKLSLLVENGQTAGPEVLEELVLVLTPVRDKIDVLCLGCTHFPVVEASIQQVLGPAVRLVNPAREVVDELRQIPASPCRAGSASRRPSPMLQFFTSQEAPALPRIAGVILARHVAATDVVRLDRVEPSLAGPATLVRRVA